MTSASESPTAGGVGELYPDLADLGGFFSLLAPPPPGTDAVPWADVLAPEALTARFATVRQALATGSGLPVDEVDPKVAVSATQVGLASRLWSVALAAAVLHRWVPDLSSTALVASPVHRGAVPLGVARPEEGYAVPSLSEAVAVLTRTVVESSLARLHEACASVGRTPERVLVSNSSSALVGAARVLAGQRPDSAGQAWELVRELLLVDAVAAGGEVLPKADLHHCVGGAMERRDEAFLRSGCCVFYRLPGHGLCPDCVLAPSRPDEVTGDH
ncbi:(2Fe-2S)-binding protein [Ornithinimicrobium tianjinense]|uniref:Ferric siderophore reductase C-terminal domain-containing protein n=1 Tax=Ornithinimicrobium tianjinense TaxID=1195761 RepID=A0A917BGX7_9MICO|nr:(2Fe-2S)-binding protein [Ornithinimicrobium tianjinense]GGF43268.1 hypothetical protein GCM10011366_08900 [Ornithinimicrobium tianjinense]